MLMENFKPYIGNVSKHMVKTLGVERVIHAAIFVLLLVGFEAFCFWVVSTYVPFGVNKLLFVTGLSLGWGMILLVMYLSFSRLQWKWWN
jgi:hypothetical protein